MIGTRIHQPARSFVVVGLLLLLFVFVRVADGQDSMIVYRDWPVYGLNSSINTTLDIYLPLNAGELLEDPALWALDVVNLPTVFFIPALNQQAMDEYAARLTDQGYAVVALDYRLQHATADSLCALSWAHTFAPVFGLDENQMVAFGYSDGGQVAALLGAMSMDPSSFLPTLQEQECPWPVPNMPMVEGVATYDAHFGTPVALMDDLFQMTTVPPAETTRSQMIAAFNEFALMPAGDWAGIRLAEPQSGYVSLSDQVRTTMATAVPNPDWVMDVAASLPVFWIDENAPPHLLMVGDGISAANLADNLAYDNTLRDLGVPVQWAQMNGCEHDPCALLEHLEPLNLFLTDVFASS
jgi:acetyl esterase/lipase